MSDPGTLRFLVVGTGRSGTTLVQRLCCELADVWVPHETHFWQLAEQGSHRFEFPLRGRLRADFVEWALTELKERELPVTPGQVMDQVRLRERRVGLLHVFESLVAAMSPPRPILGEKTPGHLLWWEHLTSASPRLKLIAVVRDPRAVLVSQRSVPWGEPDAYALAERWLLHQRAVVDAARILGSRRCLVVRYEDVAAEPDEFRTAFAEFLGVDDDVAPLDDVLQSHSLFASRETWKDSATDAITTDRVDAWQGQLDDREVTILEVTTADLMQRFGYERVTDSTQRPEPEEDAEARVAAYRVYQSQIAALGGLPLY